MTPYVDAHTHQVYSQSEQILSIRNCIVSKDYLSEQVCSAGIHPWYIDQNFDAQLSTLQKYVQKPYVLAVGECGLDKLCSTDWQKQSIAFIEQIKTANLFNKPLILHTVRTYQETLALLATQQPTVPIIFHGFNKHVELAKDLLKKNHYLSLGTDILKHRLDELILQIPLEQLFLETDDKNASIKEIYTYFCAVRKINVEQLKQQLYSNFRTVFNY